MKRQVFFTIVVVLVVALIPGMGAQPALAAMPIANPASTIVVTTVADELNSDGDCSLREAITAANTNVAVDACVSGVPGADKITFNVIGTITSSPLPNITENLTLVGPSIVYLTITSPDGSSPLREVDAGVTVDLQDLLITGLGGSCGDYSSRHTRARISKYFYTEYSTLAGPLTITDYVKTLEFAWEREVRDFGWAAPPALAGNPLPGNRYHVRIEPLHPIDDREISGSVTISGAHAGFVGDNPDTDWNDRDAYASCMLLENDFIFAGSELAAQKKQLEYTSAHEVNHAIQFGYGATAASIFREGGADWMTDEVFNESNHIYGRLWPVFEMPMANYTDPPYAYWITFRGLTERYGTGVKNGAEQVMQDFWEYLSRNNSSDAVAALNAALSKHDTNLNEAFHAYAIAVKFNKLCDGNVVHPYCFEEGPAYTTAMGETKTHGYIGSVGDSFTGTIQGGYAINWISLPTGSTDYRIALETTSAYGELNASVVCETGSALQINAFPSIVGARSRVAINKFNPSICRSIVAVITNQSPGLSAANFELTVDNGLEVDAGPDMTIAEGETFSSFGSFSDNVAKSWTGTVDYGDGSGKQPLSLNPDKTFDLSHTYSFSGVYTVTVTITDDSGGIASDSVGVTVRKLKLAFISTRDGNNEIYVMNTDGSDQTRLTNTPESESYLTWSPDGTRMAFSSLRDGNLEIYVMNADGSNQLRLTYDSAKDYYPSWSPDGRRIAFITDRPGAPELRVVNTDGSNLNVLADRAWYWGYPDWSPDGTQVAFSSHRDGNLEIYLVNADGSNSSNPTRLTESPSDELDPAWSPDGMQIAVSSYRDWDVTFNIAMINVDGTGMTYLTNNWEDVEPFWSPDGTRIAFTSWRDSIEEIYVMNPDGTSQTRLTNDPAGSGSPSWSPDGARIAFNSLQDGNREIYVMKADGSDQTRLTNNPKIDWNPVWQPLPEDVPPSGTVANRSVAVNEGDVATNTGTYTDKNNEDDVVIIASVGTVTKTGTNRGDWSWSFPTTDGPAESQSVAINLDDGGGIASMTTFTLTVNNVAPGAAFNAPDTANEGDTISMSLTNPRDPSPVDAAAGFTYAFDCGDGFGYDAFGPGNSLLCMMTDSGSRIIRGKIRDKDGGETEYSALMTVDNIAPIANFTAVPDTIFSGQSATLSFSGPFDRGSADTTAGFLYSYDCTNDGAFELAGTSDASYSCAYPVAGIFAARGRIEDKDSGFTDYTATIEVRSLNQTPTADAGGPYKVNEGSSVIVTASGSDPEGAPLIYAWDLDNDGTFETLGQSSTFSAASLDGPSSHTVTVQVTDNSGLTAIDQAAVDVLNVAPTATFTSTPSTLLLGQSATLAFINALDASAADTTAGFLYSYDCTNDGAFELADSLLTSHGCTYTAAGTFNALGRITDKDGGYADYTVQVKVLTPREGTEGLIDQVQALIPGSLNDGQGNALISKLEAVIQQLDRDKVATALNLLGAFINAVNANISSGKLTQEEGQPLLDAANAIIAALES